MLGERGSLRPMHCTSLLNLYAAKDILVWPSIYTFSGVQISIFESNQSHTASEHQHHLAPMLRIIDSVTGVILICHCTMFMRLEFNCVDQLWWAEYYILWGKWGSMLWLNLSMNIIGIWEYLLTLLLLPTKWSLQLMRPGQKVTMNLVLSVTSKGMSQWSMNKRWIK